MGWLVDEGSYAGMSSTLVLETRIGILSFKQRHDPALLF